MLGFDPQSLPQKPLTMSLMVALEPPSLRRLLKLGLRRGLSDDQLCCFLAEEWELQLDSQDALTLLHVLDERGWFRSSSSGDHWKTHLGS